MIPDRQFKKLEHHIQYILLLLYKVIPIYRILQDWFDMG